MAYSLWRNGEHLGDVVFPLPTAGRHGGIAGVFAPTPAFHDLAPIMQVRLALPPAHLRAAVASAMRAPRPWSVEHGHDRRAE